MSVHRPLGVTVDESICIGSGSCVRLARGVFELDPRGVAVVADASAATEEQLRRAERSCPTGAIFIE